MLFGSKKRSRHAKKALLESPYLVSSILFDRAMALVFPVFDVKEILKTRATGREKHVIAAAETALKRNASYFLERGFRDQTFLILQRWFNGESDYETSRWQLHNLITGRKSSVASIIPSLGIAQILMSFGFFSSSQYVFQTRSYFSSWGLIKIGARFGIYRRAKPGQSNRIINDMLDVFHGSEKRLALETSRYISIDSRPCVQSPKSALVVGPGPKEDSVLYGDYDFVFFIVTGSGQIEDLAKLLEHSPVEAVLNGAFLKSVMTGHLAEDWKSLLLRCRTIYAKPGDVIAATKIFGPGVRSAESNFTHLFGTAGKANMVQWASGLALGITGGEVSITVKGANLYSSQKIYSGSGSAVDLSRKGNRDEFQTCLAITFHNPVPNFLLVKKLWLAGRIKGDSQFLNVVAGTLEDYLLDLDSSHGKNRA